MAERVPVDVWWADLTQADVVLSRSLPATERARVTATQRPADRGRRLVAAALLQHAVAASRRAGRPVGRPVEGDRSSEVGMPAEVDVPVEVDRTCQECGAQHGRPVVAGGPHLSVAHAGVLVLVATCARARVGVDVERVARFDGSEQEALAWTRSEAAVKAGVVGPESREAFAPLEPPFAGYVATLCVAAEVAAGATVAVTEHRIRLGAPR